MIETIKDNNGNVVAICDWGIIRLAVEEEHESQDFIEMEGHFTTDGPDEWYIDCHTGKMYKDGKGRCIRMKGFTEEHMLYTRLDGTIWMSPRLKHEMGLKELRMIESSEEEDLEWEYDDDTDELMIHLGGPTVDSIRDLPSTDYGNIYVQDYPNTDLSDDGRADELALAYESAVNIINGNVIPCYLSLSITDILSGKESVDSIGGVMLGAGVRVDALSPQIVDMLNEANSSMGLIQAENLSDVAREMAEEYLYG